MNSMNNKALIRFGSTSKAMQNILARYFLSRPNRKRNVNLKRHNYASKKRRHNEKKPRGNNGASGSGFVL